MPEYNFFPCLVLIELNLIVFNWVLVVFSGRLSISRNRDNRIFASTFGSWNSSLALFFFLLPFVSSVLNCDWHFLMLLAFFSAPVSLPFHHCVDGHFISSIFAQIVIFIFLLLGFMNKWYV